ncbi:MAG: response regulator [Candidatus Omnitrophota bacterium]|nr:response regulator [Candidatus Omnitrophota bacterium]
MEKKILVIDDEEILTRTFNILLEKNGYQVYTAKHGDDAQAMAEEEKFDLILCDIRMPGMNGVDIMRAIRGNEESSQNRDVPVIFITGYADANIESEAQELGPLAYIHKPFDNAEILKTIKEALIA